MRCAAGYQGDMMQQGGMYRLRQLACHVEDVDHFDRVCDPGCSRLRLVNVDNFAACHLFQAQVRQSELHVC